MQVLLSLPPNASSCFADIEGKREPEWVASCDPPGSRLGSGGGTAHLLADAWRRTGADSDFGSWLSSSQKLVVHAGGQSRRLPAYAATGKVLIPIPVFRWSTGQRLDQKLLDVQIPFYRSLLAVAPGTSRVMVTSGDVLIRCDGAAPPLPEAHTQTARRQSPPPPRSAGWSEPRAPGGCKRGTQSRG